MKKKKTILGICRICKERKELTFEHIPPRSAFNKSSRYFTIDSTEYYQNFEQYNNNEMKPKSKLEQGGLGEYCLCEDCNGFLGSKYVREYKKFAEIAMSIIYNNEDDIKCYEFDISDINLLKFLKQIIAIFVCTNQPVFTDSYPELIEFIRDPNNENLVKRYRVYMYLNNVGQIRTGKLHFTNTHGAICDFAFPPFGFVLSIDNPKRIMEVSEITNFKHYNKLKSLEKLPIILNRYPTHYPFPLDFREK
jgi:hypothetical protein